jgi:pyruvate/2-oxoacid:ferredoxin oxidoreductase beta subunit
MDRAKRKPVKDYFVQQGRFRNLKETNVEEIEKWIDEDWERYRKLASTDSS